MPPTKNNTKSNEKKNSNDINWNGAQQLSKLV